MRPRVVAALLLAAACGDPLAPLPTAEPPDELAYVDGGFAAEYRRVRLAGDTIVLTTRAYGPQGSIDSETRRVPSAEEWRAFWRAVGEAGVRRWPGACRSDPLYDGPTIQFTLAWSGERRSGHYFESRPTAAGRCSRTDRTAVDRFGAPVLRVAEGSVLQAVRAP